MGLAIRHPHGRCRVVRLAVYQQGRALPRATRECVLLDLPLSGVCVTRLGEALCGRTPRALHQHRCAHLAYCCLLVRHRGDRMEICGAAVDAMGERDSAHPDVSAQDFPIDAFSEARDKLNICSCERLRPGLNDCHTFASDLDTTHGSYGIRCCPS